jgi:Leu/Phe-tRNA-protein transferase
MVRLSTNPRDLRFPPVDSASPEGLLAVGGDLQPERLLEGYRTESFPGTATISRSCGGRPIPDRPLSRHTPYLAQPEKKPTSWPIQRHARPVLSRRDATLRRTKAAIPGRRHVDHCRDARSLHTLTRTRVCPFRRNLAGRTTCRRTVWRGTGRRFFRRVDVHPCIRRLEGGAGCSSCANCRPGNFASWIANNPPPT